MLSIRPFLLFCITTLLLAAAPSLAARPSEVSLSPLQDPRIVVAVAPSLVSMPVSDTVDIRVGIENPVDLYAFDITLDFQAPVIQIDDGDPNRSGVQVRLGSLFDGSQLFVATNHVNNEAGTIHVAASLLGTDAAINTNGDLITMTVRAKANGTSPLVLTEVLLADPAANLLSADLIGGVIIVGTDIITTPGPTSTPTVPSSPTPSLTATPTSIPVSPTVDLTVTPTSTPSPTITNTLTATPTRTSVLRSHVQLPLILRNYQAIPARSQ